jgi:hypothetical protein
VDRWLEAAEATDAQENKLHGASRRGDEMPGWIADKQKRLAKIREAREALEAEAASAAAAKAEAERAAEEKRKAESDLIYQGIAERNFERNFQLADHVQIKGASLENGLLQVDLLRVVPEAMKPRAIPITTAKKVVLDGNAPKIAA